MADLSQRIKAELENIDKALKEMPAASKLSYLSPLELAGTATLLHNFYTGMENILKQILISKKISIPEGNSWHKDLLEVAVKSGVLSEKSGDNLKKYLVFRHFFSHAYALDLYHDRMELLVESTNSVYQQFKNEMEQFLQEPS